MSGFLTFVAIVVFFVLWCKDSAGTASWKAQDKQKAVGESRLYYWDDKGKMYSVRTNERVVPIDVYEELSGNGERRNYRVHQALVRAKDMKIIQVDHSQNGRTEMKFPKFLKRIIVDGKVYYSSCYTP